MTLMNVSDNHEACILRPVLAQFSAGNFYEKQTRFGEGS